MEHKSLIFILLAFLHLDWAYCANILMVQPALAKSHSRFIQPLAEELIKRGHNLTLLSAFPLNDQFQSNYTYFDLGKSCQHLRIPFENLVTKSEIKGLLSCFSHIPDFLEAGVRSPEMEKILLSEDRYDLVMVEFFFFDSYFALGPKFHAPVVGFLSQSMLPFQNWVVGQEFPASYVPNTFSSMTENMSLMSRIHNAVVNVFSILYYEFISLPNSQELIEKYFHFGREKAPQIRDILKNVSVFLVNAHYSFGYSKPILPNIVHVGGMHLTSPTLLPQSIKVFMEEAEHGVIYVSLGSLLPLHMCQSLGEIFIRVFEKLPQRVIMKWDKNAVPYIPNNTLVQEWLPQSDILHHPNCRLFISHGGLLGLIESLNASVPIIGVPFFADQHHNVALVEYYKMGLTLPFEDVPIKLLERVEEVLKNPVYKKNIEKRSKLFQERLVRPLDEAMFWVDHVLKHKDVSHLRPASTKLTWYQLYSLDVAAILMVSLYIIVKIVMFLLMALKGSIFSKAKITKKTDLKVE